MIKSPFIICLMGPTASGKTQLAIELTRHFPLDIISVDSAMVYRGMNIGTAKPSSEELCIAPHRLIDICDPKQIYSAGQFREDALKEIHQSIQQGRIPLLVGGTMLYFHVLQYGLSELPAANQEVRAIINTRAEKEGWLALYKFLQEIDPKTAFRIHLHDQRRIQRALEIYFLSGKTPTELAEQKNQKFSYTALNLALASSDRAALHQRIEQRFHQMLEKGLIAETEQLFRRSDLHPDLPSLRSVGYRQVWHYLAGKLTYDEMREQGIAATRQLAKRQYTWLRSWSNLHWVDHENSSGVSYAAQKINEMIL